MSVPDCEPTPPIYQRRVRDLTAQVRELTAGLAEERKLRADEQRRAAAELREGLTPELALLRKELTRWRNRALAAEAQLREVRR